ncbi:MAG: pantoate--beta-alanine ligase [Pseudohongiellaceae bacterium]|nr:pantoate--beta-alanine ligase [Pseudohongiellaceae bacterium]
MDKIRKISELRAAVKSQRQQGKKIVLVPTMGNLHAGHIHLVKQARLHGDFVVCTIFVNPMQFGANEDLDAYPRTFEQDCEKLEAAHCDLVFSPTVTEVYPRGLEGQSVVSVPQLSTRHCGASRPGHFDGVSTVVCKLFNMVQPDSAVFGLKDYQQFMVITKMVEDLCIPVQLIGEPTQRDSSGLALSSRNGYLSEQQLAVAPGLYRTLLDAQSSLEAGNEARAVEEQAKHALSNKGFELDYFNISDAFTLEPAQSGNKEVVILAAAKLGSTRLIDNIRVSL